MAAGMIGTTSSIRFAQFAEARYLGLINLGRQTVVTSMAHADHRLVGKVARAATNVRVSVPATRAMRQKVLADYRAAHGFDLDDNDRAALIRARVKL